MNFRTRIIDLHVIDAPSNNYGQAGASEAVALQYRLRDTGINVVPHIAWDVNSLEKCLNDVRDYRQKYRYPRKALPFIHVAAGHGISDGLVIGSDVPVGWNVLAEMLSGINRLTDHNLLLGLSSCRGLCGYRMACHETEKPFYLLIAPRQRRKTVVLVDAFAIVYRKLFHGHSSIKQAVLAANAASPRAAIILEYAFGREVHRWFTRLQVDDPHLLTKRRKQRD